MTVPLNPGRYVPFDPLAIPIEGIEVVEASAGTGKTYSITLLYLRCLLEKRLDVREVLVVTFTRAATAELRDRIREGLVAARTELVARESGTTPAGSVDANLVALLDRVGTESRVDAIRRLSAALDGLDRASIYTIDGLFQRVLARTAFESGEPFESELVTDTNSLVADLADDVFASRYSNGSVEAFRARAFATPKVVSGYLAKVTENPRIPVVPPDVDDRALAEIERAFDEACRAYVDARASSGDDDAIRAAVKVVRPRVSNVEALAHFDAIASRRSPPRLVPPNVWENVSEATLLAEAAKSKKPVVVPALPVFAAVDALAAASTRCARARLAREANAVARAGLEAFERATRGRGKLTYGAIAETLRTRIEDAERGAALAKAVAGTYGVALIDESQDTNEAQFAFFLGSFAREGRPLVVIGDPKQAIYRFRGADVHAYLEARERARARHSMATNFRSRPELVRTIDVLYRGAESPFGAIDIDVPAIRAGRDDAHLPKLVDPESSSAVEVLYLPKGASVAEAAAADIARTLRTASLATADGETVPIAPRQIAVLCKSNTDIDAVSAALRRLGVPTVGTSKGQIFESDEAGAMRAWLAALLEPNDGRAVRSLLASTLFHFDPRSLDAFSRDDARWDAFVESLARARADLATHGVGYAYARFAREHAIDERLLARPDGYRATTNLTHLAELLTAAESEKSLGLEGLVSWFERARGGETEEGGATEERELRLEHSGDAVQVLTIHRSKGLEYDLTYLVGIAKKSAPRGGPEVLRLAGKGRVLTPDVRLDPELGEVLAKEFEEDAARLAYVAMTRAKLALRVVVAAQIGDDSKSKGSKSGLASAALGRVLVGPAAPSEGIDGPALRDFLVSRFASLRAEHGASIGLREPGPPSSERYVPRIARPQIDPPAPVTRSFADTRRTSSFSGLVVGAESVRPADRDSAPREAFVVEGAADPLADAPAGRELGVLVHGVLEALDFDADPDAIDAAVAEAIAVAPGFEPHRAAIATVVGHTLATPLTTTGIRLADVPRNRTFRELEFHLAVRGDAGFSAATLAEVFRAHSVPLGDASYADAIAALPFETLRGYLRGFVDLVFEHGGRFYVVDYKTNRLGPPSAYAPRELARAMKDHHYVLQHALYTLALHRMARARIRDYAYDTHVGGSLYLFVRGMDPARGPASGTYEERLPAAFVEALDALFEGSRP